MKSLPEDDPRSWTFQAAMHGTTGPVTNPLFNQCQHGSLQFFTWHRGYLHFFERILRWAAQDDSLNLPYWNWTSSPAIPEPYRLPASTGNPLYDQTRNINDGSELPPQVVVIDLQTALDELVFPSTGITGFSPSLEGSPHGSVHVLIGGNMGSVPTAARDPIFWLHHCNVDRNWDRWINLKMGRANPTSNAFLDQPYSYANEYGATVTVKVRDIISSANLGYRYDDTPPTEAVLSQMSSMALVQATQPPRTASVNSMASDKQATPLEQVDSRRLTFKPETVKIGIAPVTKMFGQSGTVEVRKGEKVLLTVEGISLRKPPTFTYGVYLNLPEVAGANQSKDHYVGSLDFFGKTTQRGLMHNHGGANSFDATFDVTNTVNRLQASKAWNPETLAVTLKPITVIPAPGREEAVKAAATASAEDSDISFKRISFKFTSGEIEKPRR